MRVVEAPLYIEFAKIDGREEEFRIEFDKLSENNDDPIGSWLKNAKARGKIIDENEPIVQLLIELYRKIDALSMQLNNIKKEYLNLDYNAMLHSVGHNILNFRDEVLVPSVRYYARLDIAVFPARKMPMFFEAQNSKSARIYHLHSKDEADFDSYIAARERSLIRESRARR